MDASTLVYLVLIVTAMGSAPMIDGHRPTVLIRGQMVLGGNLTLACVDPVSSTRFPNKTVSFLWYKDDKVIPGEHGNEFALINASIADHGDYTCRLAETETRTLSPLSNKISVSINIPPEVQIDEADGHILKLAEGANLSLTCSVSNSQKPFVIKGGISWTVRAVTWKGEASTVSSQEVNLSDPRQSWFASPHRADQVLTIISVNRSHSGVYTCHATNDRDKTLGLPPATASTEVQVQYLDDTVAVSPAKSKTMVAGDKVNLTCQADSLPTATLTWLHQGYDLFSTNLSDSGVLLFTATGCQDSGDYTCRADNLAVNKSARGVTSLVVECPPAPAHAEDQELLEVTGTVGENLSLSAAVQGTPPLLYSWSGPGLPSAQRRSPRVDLFPLQPWHAGVFTLTVFNRHGVFTQKFRVSLRQEAGKQPEPDEETSASAGNSMLWLTVAGVGMAVLLCQAFICLLLRWRRRRRQRRNSIRKSKENQCLELYYVDHRHSTRWRRSEEVADYSFGESEGHYCVVDSSDLSWQPQTVQPPDSLTQDSGEVSCDLAPVSARQPSTHTLESRGDIEGTADVRVNEGREELPHRDDSSLAQRPGHRCGEGDPKSDDSECSLACRVVSHDPPPSTPTSTPQDIYLTPLFEDVGGGGDGGTIVTSDTAPQQK